MTCIIKHLTNAAHAKHSRGMSHKVKDRRGGAVAVPVAVPVHSNSRHSCLIVS